MARMKTGRLTTMTTPPEKYVVTSKRETVKPRELTDKEKKYNADMEAGEKYKSDLAAYNEKKKAYDKSTLKDPKNYALFGGKQNTRSLAGSELAEYNKKTGSNYSKVEVSKDLKKVGEKDLFFGSMDKPIAPNKVTPPNSNDMPMGRMPLNKITSIKSKQSMAKGKEVAEKADFVNPAKKAGSNAVSMNPLAGGAKTKGAGKRYVKQVVASVGGPNNRGYNKEEKRFKAYAGTTATGDDLSSMTPGEIRNYRKEAKSARADYRKQPDSEVKAMGKAAMTSDIRQSRKAEKFAKQVYNTSGKEKSVKFFNDKNYGGNIVKDYRESAQNAANRNTMDAKIKAIGNKAKSRAASFNGQMPL